MIVPRAPGGEFHCLRSARDAVEVNWTKFITDNQFTVCLLTGFLVGWMPLLYLT